MNAVNMSWLKKSRYYRMFIPFVCGVAAASIIWLFFYQPSRELPTQPRAPLMPGALGDPLYPQLKTVSPFAAPGPKLPGAISRNSPVQVPEAIEDPPVPGAVENPPVPEAGEEPPVPGVVDDPPVPEMVGEPPTPETDENSPVLDAFEEPPGAVEYPPVPEASEEPPVPGVVDDPLAPNVNEPSKSITEGVRSSHTKL